ncbi:MAG: S41 family peptidase, partial [Gemmatimonadetes bacterium]|nr:S41 family peptidase [Gemmatimonadota bacterium]
MTRSTPSLRLALVLAALTVAAPASAQDTASRARGGAGSSAAGQDVFMSALDAIQRLHMTAPTDSALWERAIDGLIAGLDDPYAQVFTPAEVEAFEEQNTGNYAGIGIQITQLNDRVTVTAVFNATPANNAGMQEGDVIVEIDGVDAREFSTDSVSKVVRGTPGTMVRVSVEREGYGQPIPFDLTRAEVHVPTVRAGSVGGDVTYVVMDRFARGAIQEMDSVLRDNSDMSGLVVDLRGNPGGYLDEALMLSDLFLAPGQKLASTRSRTPGSDGERSEESWTDRVPPRIPDVPMVILVDEFSASASEILAGALQDHDRALVVGQRSFGKGLVQTVMPLPHGRQIRLTTGEWLTPLGRSLHRARASDGRPLPEDVDTFPRITSESGRELVATGGIFPDLTVQDDTLTLAERALLQGAVEAELPLPLRLAEFGFAEAQRLEAAGQGPMVDEGRFQAFVAELRDEGLPSELLDADGAEDYLRFRASLSIADRMDDLGARGRFLQERDPVLREAVRLLR